MFVYKQENALLGFKVVLVFEKIDKIIKSFALYLQQQDIRHESVDEKRKGKRTKFYGKLKAF